MLPLRGHRTLTRWCLAQKYNAAAAVIEEVERQGAKVLYDIDATRLSQCLYVGQFTSSSLAPIFLLPLLTALVGECRQEAG